MARGGGRKRDISRDEPAAACTPRIPTRDRAAEGEEHDPVVATRVERSAGGDDVLERSAVDADLEDAAVEAVLEAVLMVERQVVCARRQVHDRGAELVV